MAARGSPPATFTFPADTRGPTSWLTADEVVREMGAVAYDLVEVHHGHGVDLLRAGVKRARSVLGTGEVGPPAPEEVVVTRFRSPAAGRSALLGGAAPAPLTQASRSAARPSDPRASTARPGCARARSTTSALGVPVTRDARETRSAR